MAEVEITYYFNSRSTGNWTDPDNMINGELGNYASTASDGTTETLDGNTCPGTDLGAITEVALRAYGYGDGDDRIDLTPVYDGIDERPEKQLTIPSSPDWSAYISILADMFIYYGRVPTWGEIQALDVKAEYDKVGKGNPVYCGKVEIRITYTEAGGYYHGFKVQGEGELALCDVGTHPLRVRKGGTTYGLELVDTTDGNASPVRIKTGAGIKAIRKYT